LARPPRLEVSEALYHATARGNERRALFRVDADRQEYLSLLATCREKFRFQLLAYCLMTNHVHLVIRTGAEPLARIMARLHSIYAQWFNRRHDRVGHLFQGRYKACLVRDDRYLHALLRYVHRNPVSARIVPRAADYNWSSDRFLRSGEGPAWLDVDPLLALLDGSRRAAMRRYAALVDGVAPASIDEPREAVERAAATVRIADTDPNVADNPNPTLRQIRLDDLLEIVASECGLTLPDLAGRARGGEVADARCRAAHLARRLFRIPLRRVALRLHRDDSAFARPLGRLENRLERDEAVRARMQRLTDTLLRAAAQGEIRNQD
jgi:REP element-mobilizing transposase RayT